MSQEQATVHPIGVATQTQEPPPKPSKPKPSQTLPTDRIIFSKQLSLLRAYAAASGHEGKAVTTTEVSGIAKISPTTISQSNAFFIDTGLIQKTPSGFLPSAEVIAFARAHEWNPEKASHKLAPLFEQTWFAKALLPKLSFGKVAESEAIADLAQAATAGPECKSQVRLLIDFLESAGLVQREGDSLRKPAASANAAPPAGERPPAAHEHKETPHREAAAPARSSVTSAFSQMTGGVVQFNISVKVDMAEFSGWSPDRITAFFGGIAQVLAAKGAVEQEASRE